MAVNEKGYETDLRSQELAAPVKLFEFPGRPVPPFLTNEMIRAELHINGSYFTDLEIAWKMYPQSREDLDSLLLEITAMEEVLQEVFPGDDVQVWLITDGKRTSNKYL